MLKFSMVDLAVFQTKYFPKLISPNLKSYQPISHKKSQTVRTFKMLHFIMFE